MAEGITGWRLHVGVIFPTPVPPRAVLEFYEAALQAGYFQPISTTWLWHDSYAPVRKTERFKRYIRDIGLEDFFRARGWPAHCRWRREPDRWPITCTSWRPRACSPRAGIPMGR